MLADPSGSLFAASTMKTLLNFGGGMKPLSVRFRPSGEVNQPELAWAWLELSSVFRSMTPDPME